MGLTARSYGADMKGIIAPMLSESLMAYGTGCTIVHKTPCKTWLSFQSIRKSCRAYSKSPAWCFHFHFLQIPHQSSHVRWRRCHCRKLQYAALTKPKCMHMKKNQYSSSFILVSLPFHLVFPLCLCAVCDSLGLDIYPLICSSAIDIESGSSCNNNNIPSLGTAWSSQHQHVPRQ